MEQTYKVDMFEVKSIDDLIERIDSSYIEEIGKNFKGMKDQLLKLY